MMRVEIRVSSESDVMGDRDWFEYWLRASVDRPGNTARSKVYFKMVPR